MTEPVAAARAIYQANLDAVGVAFWARDWDTIVRLIHTPSVVSSLDSVSRHDTPEAMIASFSKSRDAFGMMGVTEYHRVCFDADFADGTQMVIAGEHTTHLIRGGSHLLPPYHCVMCLQKIDLTWRAAGLHCEISNADLMVVPEKVHPLSV